MTRRRRCIESLLLVVTVLLLFALAISPLAWAQDMQPTLLPLEDSAGESLIPPALAASNLLEAPTHLVASRQSATSIRVSFSPAPSASSYQIYRFDSVAGEKPITSVSSTEYVDQNLSTGRSYRYAVVAVGWDGTAEIASPKSETSNTVVLPLETPGNVAIANINTTILRISWDKIANATQYALYRATAEEGTYKQIATTKTTTFDDTGLAGGKTYYYKIRALGTATEFHSEYSAVKGKVARLPAVTKLTAQKTAGNAITVSWSNATTVKGYRVYRATALGGTYKQIAETTKKTYVDKSLPRCKTYYYKVRAIHTNTKLNSVLAGPTDGVAIQLSSPKDVKVANVNPTQLKISWKAVSGAVAYEVQRSSAQSPPYATVATTTNLALTDKNLTPNETYSYRIRALKSTTSTKYSSPVSAVVSKKATFVAPVLTAQWKDPAIRLTWKSVSGAQHYHVFRKGGADAAFVKLGETTNLSFIDKTGTRDVKYTYKVRARAVIDGIVVSRDSAAITRWYTRIDPTKPMIALTFDDGPGPYTKTIIDTLNAYDARATFFVLGGRMGTYGSVTKYALKSGHEIGNHTMHHGYLTGYTNAEVKYEMTWTNDTIRNAVGFTPKLMRPPGGFVDARVAAATGMPVIMWSVDTNDWRTQSAIATANSVLSARDGDIVIMHDVHYSTMQAMSSTIAELDRRGVQMVTVSELAKYKGTSLKNGSIYYSIR